MSKILCIGFSPTGTTKPFDRLNLFPNVQKATFARKAVMDFCFVELVLAQNEVYKDSENVLYSLRKTDNAPFFQRDLNVKKETDGRMILSVNALSDFLPYIEKLNGTLKSFGRSSWARNWSSNLEKNAQVIQEHVYSQYGLDFRPRDEAVEEESKVIIVR